MNSKSVTKKHLFAVAKEMNTLLQLKPPIPTDPKDKKLTAAVMIKDIADTAKVCFKDGDVISEQTQEVLTALAIPFPDQAIDESAEEKAETKPKAEKKKAAGGNGKKYNRLTATLDAVAVFGADEEDKKLATEASKLYLENGGTSAGDKEEKQSLWWVKNFRAIFTGMQERRIATT
jgi:hypothetical protein